MCPVPSLSCKSNGKTDVHMGNYKSPEICEEKGAGCGGKLRLAGSERTLMKVTLKLQAYKELFRPSRRSEKITGWR